MSGQDVDRAQWLEQRVAMLERDRERRILSDAYGRLYAAIAVVSLALTFLPLFEDVPIKSDGEVIGTVTYGSLWDMAGRNHGDPAVLGLLLVAVLLGLLTLAAVRETTRNVPIGIAGTSVLILLMLIAKPGTGTPTPELSGPGMAGTVLAVLCLVVGAIHAIHLSSRH